jgi:hypothetical protein
MMKIKDSLHSQPKFVDEKTNETPREIVRSAATAFSSKPFSAGTLSPRISMQPLIFITSERLSQRPLKRGIN